MNNEPAFPCEWGKVVHTPGMTMRDYFAAKAMQQMIMIELKNDYESSEERMESVAKISYKMADAMLKARETA